MHARQTVIARARGRREPPRVALHLSYGHASIREYAEAIVGLSPRETEERLRVARALEALPEVAAKFRMDPLCGREETIRGGCFVVG